MDSSRRAVESYWRSRMIDGVTSDEDKVAPVYKLEEICELLRNSHISIVKEVSEFILKRVDHNSPIVKQKALRLIKYSVGKSGVEFKREMQRHSAAIRQLFHYKGQLDPLKADALNKAVRDTAHEAITAIFASEDNKPAPTEDINRRIQGFGNTNFEMPMEDKKSFLSEVVGLGSASIRQGLSTITAAHSLRKNDNGSYKSPNLRRSLTTEIDSSDRYERDEHSGGNLVSSGASKNVTAGTWSQDSRPSTAEIVNGDSGSTHTGAKSREERLLETIVTSGGVRLQPTRDAIQVFLVEASKLDAMALSQALESKLQSHLWQVRMKAVCVLESILRKKDHAHFATIGSYFSENRDAVVKCSESPQASLREKANKVLGLLDGEQATKAKSITKTETTTIVQMPDLIDTGDPDDYGREDSTEKQIDPSITNLTSSTHVVDDLFGDNLVTGVSTSENRKEDDPFANVSFHTADDRERVDDLFSGLTIDDKIPSNEYNMPTNNYRAELFDVFNSNSDQPPPEPLPEKKDMNDLMAGLTAPEYKKQGAIGGAFSDASFLDLSNQSSHHASSEAFNGVLGSQNHSPNPSYPNPLFPLGPMQYNIPPNLMFNSALSSQPINYGAVGSLTAQQQLLATMSNFQQFGNFSAPGNGGLGHTAGNDMGGGYASAFPDVYHLTNNHVQSLGTTNSTKKEETKAFDFISDHLSAARDTKRVV
ncbi:protein MODIFIED TRANSPORT TO THE VACUOLE 1-like [Tasmannia lanceolata]|uniref:protein MODIFIED TRANSPORT TO THE VACUOLE 1-like n=1 Tax=Tasmannia lanceolata TaxID=3420 RepID=UPI004063F7AC